MIDYIVIHCSDSPHGRGDGAKEIHRWHKERGFDGIGYHYVINEQGGCENGRPLYWAGAHVKGYNSRSIGICLIGEGTYTLEQWDTLETLTSYLTNRFKDAVVVGHNDLDKSKPCPCFDVKEWYQSI
jgi:N-acetylmuramoyl-L-alanine amidase